MDQRTLAGGGLGQTDTEAPDMHLHAVALQQATVELGGIDFRAGLLGGQQLDVGIDFLANQIAGPCQALVVHRLGRQFELAVADQVAGDLLLLHQRHHALHRAFVSLVISPRLVSAEAGAEPGVVLGNAGVALAAIAPRRFTDDLSGLEHHHTGALQGQRPGRRQAGETTTDDGHVDLPRQCAELCTAERRCGVEPVGFTAHV